MMNDRVPLESTEQQWLFQWAQCAELKWPELHWMHHIPNGGSRNKAEAARLKAQGVKSGVSDIFLPAPRGVYHGLYIEMKRRKGGSLSKDQKDFVEAMRKQGYRVEVCKGFHAAADVIEEYMGGDTQ